MNQQKSFEKHETGTLFLVPTPIGNLQDMTPRAIDTLNAVALIAAEDTRHTQQLLNHFDIETKQTSFHEHNWQSKIPSLIATLSQGGDVAQVSDAGMPSISDPGKELVAAAVENNIPVVPIPGATAGVTALIASGLVPQPFYFYGFLQRKNSEQLSELKQLSTVKELLGLLKVGGSMILSNSGRGGILEETGIVVVDNRSYSNAYITLYRRDS